MVVKLEMCPELTGPTTDGVVLQGYLCAPSRPDWILVWVHGLGDWSGSYCQLASYMAAQGCVWTAYDQRGHGRSGGARGVVGDYAHLLGDLSVFVSRVRNLYPDQPLWIGGHSLGGALVARTVQSDSIPCQGAIILSPWLRLVRTLGPLWMGVALGAGLVPSWTVRNGLTPEQLVSDPELALRLSQDPLRHLRISLRLLQGAWRNGRYCMAQEGTLPVPVGVWHGLQDTVTSCEASRQWARRMGADFYPVAGARHEIHWEMGSEKMGQSLMEWVESRRTR